MTVLYFHDQTNEDQARAGFDRAFAWDVPLLDGYPYRRVANRARRRTLRSFWGTNSPEIANVIEELKPAAVIVLGWNARAAVQAIRAGRRYGARVFVRTDSQLNPSPWWKSTVKALAYRRLLPALEYFCAGTRSAAYLRHYGVPDQKIHVLPHVIDNQRFSGAAADSAAAEIRRDLGVGPDELLLLYVGKFLPIKKPNVALAAFRRAIAERSDLKLALIGSGPLRRELEQRYGSTSGVRFVGFVNQSALPAYYQAADYLILPGRESWGMVVNEAAACGTPAIVSEEAGSYPEVVEGDGIGVGFDGTVEGLALQLSRLRSGLVSPGALAQWTGARSPERVAARVLDVIGSTTPVSC